LNRLAAFADRGIGARRGIEVVSADSMQVYRGMDIGTAKPSPEERRRIPYHLIDIRSPGEQFNAGDFVRLADECCGLINGRGALPVVSGGTGFYLKNFILGLGGAPPSDREIRSALREELRLQGAAVLMKELSQVDPASAARIHLNDEYRLLRALEVFRLSGRPLSSYAAFGSSGSVEGPGRGGRYRFLTAGLRRGREELYRRINERCAWMFRSGLPGEVKALVEQGYGPQDPGLRAIGYREFFIPSSGGEGEDTPQGFRLAADLTAVEALAAQNSRRYAKRQITYFASIPAVQWIDLEGAGGDPAELLSAMVRDFLTGLSTQ
jgi:tRNA dimethylallyltransferase